MKNLFYSTLVFLFTCSAYALPVPTVHGFKVVICTGFSADSDITAVNGYYLIKPPHNPVARLIVWTESEGRDIINNPENDINLGVFRVLSADAELTIDGQAGETEKGFPSSITYKGKSYTGIFCTIDFERPSN